MTIFKDNLAQPQETTNITFHKREKKRKEKTLQNAMKKNDTYFDQNTRVIFFSISHKEKCQFSVVGLKYS